MDRRAWIAVDLMPLRTRDGFVHKSQPPVSRTACHPSRRASAGRAQVSPAGSRPVFCRSTNTVHPRVCHVAAESPAPRDWLQLLRVSSARLPPPPASMVATREGRAQSFIGEYRAETGATSGVLDATDVSAPLDQQRWFFPGMSQAEAVGVLAARAPRGGFIVTPVHNSPSVFLAHVKEALLVKTYAIRQEGPEVFRMAPHKDRFATIPHLVLHYSQNAYANDIDGAPCTLFLSRGEAKAIPAPAAAFEPTAGPAAMAVASSAIATTAPVVETTTVDSASTAEPARESDPFAPNSTHDTTAATAQQGFAQFDSEPAATQQEDVAAAEEEIDEGVSLTADREGSKRTLWMRLGGIRLRLRQPCPSESAPCVGSNPRRSRA